MLTRFTLASAAVMSLLCATLVHAQDRPFFVAPRCGGSIQAPATFTWSSVPRAQAYYLYLGTQPGAKDLVNTGEIQTLSYTAAALSGSTVYGRIWAKVDSIWRFSDCTFTLPPPAASTFTAPSAGAQITGNPASFSWTSVSGALAYYLYVGTAPGLKDVVDTGEINQTAYAATLPAGRHLYARIHTKFSDRWLSRDVDFTTAAAPPASLLQPANGAITSGAQVTFSWTSSSGALAYYLYVGTAPGLKDVVDTGEISATTITRPVPEGRQLFARIYTKFVDHWESRDSQFRTASVVSWTWPRDGASSVPSPATFRWTPVQGATYDVSIGTVAGGNDVLQAQGLSAATMGGVTLPAHTQLFGRIVAHVNGGAHQSSIQFTTAGPIASVWSTFVYPFDGATGVGAATHIEWTPVEGAISYYLYVGRRPGAKDVIDYGEVQTTSVEALTLPAGPLFGRIWTRFASGWKYSDIVFSADASVLPTMAYPSATETQPVNLDYPLEWFAVPGAAAYRLQLGTAAGRADLVDTGSIVVTRRFVPGFTSGQRIFGRLGALVGGAWQWTAFQFVSAGAPGDVEPRINASLALTGTVRGMANSRNEPQPGSKLAEFVAAAGRQTAFCTEYAQTLLALMTQASVGLQATAFSMCLNPSNNFDCHTLVSAVDPRTGKGVLLDPTMGFAPVSKSTRRILSAADMGTAAGTQSFGDLGFEFVSPQTDRWATDYYLDYPLLFLSLAPGHSPLELMESLGSFVAGPLDLYAVQCLNGTTAAVLDGNLQPVPCRGTDQLTQVFLAHSIAAPPGGTIRVWRPRRYIFLQ
jgi:hypothetical protein